MGKLGGHGLDCPEDHGEREIWGCDGETEPYGPFQCSCKGGCSICGGTGSIVLRRCVGRHATQEVREVIWAWRMLKTHKAWPDPGGVQDQAAVFIDAVSVLDAELASAEASDRKAAEAKARKMSRGRK